MLEPELTLIIGDEPVDAPDELVLLPPVVPLVVPPSKLLACFAAEAALDTQERLGVHPTMQLIPGMQETTHSTAPNTQDTIGTEPPIIYSITIE